MDRNLVKRTVREQFRTRCKKTTSMDYNVVIDTGVKLQFPFAQNLQKCLQEAFENGSL